MVEAGDSETAVRPLRNLVLILHHAADLAAVWLASSLREHFGDRVLLLTIDELVYSKSIVHHFDSCVDESSFQLFDGRKIRSECIAGVINRLCMPPDRHLENVAQSDRLYSTQELHAFWLGWLNSLPVSVINPPRPNALIGLSSDDIAMHHAVATAGLPCQALEFRIDGAERQEKNTIEAASNLSLIVFNERVFGPIVSASLSMAAIRFASLLGLSLVQIDFLHDPSGQLCFQRASALADVRIGGRSLVRRLAATLMPQLFDIQEHSL